MFNGKKQDMEDKREQPDREVPHSQALDVEKTAHSLKIAVNGEEIGVCQDHLVKRVKFSADVLTILSPNKNTLDPPNPNHTAKFFLRK